MTSLVVGSHTVGNRLAVPGRASMWNTLGAADIEEDVVLHAVGSRCSCQECFSVKASAPAGVLVNPPGPWYASHAALLTERDLCATLADAHKSCLLTVLNDPIC